MIKEVQFTDMEWRHVPGYEGLYMVNNYGEIMRCKFRQANMLTGGESVFPSLVVRQKVAKNGYHCVTLCKSGERKMWLVHRLVAKAFLGAEDNDGMQVNHIDGNKSNNSVNNLELVTAKENTRHAFLTGLRTRKVDESVLSDIITRYLHGESQRSIARLYKIHYQTVNEYISKYKKGEVEWLEG